MRITCVDASVTYVASASSAYLKCAIFGVFWLVNF